MADSIVMATRHNNLPSSFRLGQTQFEPLPPMARFVFRGDEQAREKVGQALGVTFPVSLRANTTNDISVLWQGPDEFLVLGNEDKKSSLTAPIESACRDLLHALVDVSHRNVGFVLEGPDVELLLATAIQLDLSLPHFPIGMTTRTLFAKADITLWRQAAERFHVEVWRSFLPYVIGLLREGARGL